MALKRTISKDIKQLNQRAIISLTSLVVYSSWLIFIFKIAFFYNILALIIDWNLFSLKMIAITSLVIPLILMFFTFLLPVSFIRVMELCSKIPYFGKRVKEILSGELDLFYEREEVIEKKMRVRSEKLEGLLKGWGI